MHLSSRIIMSVGIVLCGMPAMSAAEQVTGQDLLQGLGVTQEELDRLEDGEILAYSDKTYESTKRELAADAMALIDTDLAAVRETLRGATTLIPVKLLVDHGAIDSEADFAAIEYAPEDFDEVEQLFSAKPGKKFNFSNEEYSQLGEMLAPHRNADRAAKTAAASNAMRQILLGRYQQYRHQGLRGIAPYQRSRKKQVDISKELMLTTETFEVLAKDFPEFYNVMVNYPDGEECCENYFRWLKVDLQGRPTFVLSHTIIQTADDFVLMTERHFFASNTLNATQVNLGWVPYADGTYMGLAMSANADILDSMAGKMLRALGRNKAKDLVTDVLTDARAELKKDGDADDNAN